MTWVGSTTEGTNGPVPGEILTTLGGCTVADGNGDPSTELTTTATTTIVEETIAVYSAVDI